MNLSEYIRSERGRGAALAAALDISPSYLSQLAMPGASISPARCVEIERATAGQVTRRELRDDWKAIWPELEECQDKTAACAKTVRRSPTNHPGQRAGDHQHKAGA